MVYIPSTVPAKAVRVSDTTLFHVARQETGDALQWVALAQLNGITDPWIMAERRVLIPPVLPGGAQTGVLGL